MNTDAVLRELGGLRALARSLVHGDADADDLMQDTAIAALEHPPDADRPLRPWLAVVLRNRWRMDYRAATRRLAREQSVEESSVESPDAALDRARVLEQLAAALTALDEPFRTTIVKRYLDGQSAADIARAQGVPAGTVRWRIKTGLARLRATLDDRAGNRWRAAIAPFVLPGVIVKTKTTIIAVAILIALLMTAGIVLWKSGGSAPHEPRSAGHGSPAVELRVPHANGSAEPAPAPDPLPGQGRAKLERVTAAGGVVAGRVINWSTGDGVADADLTFTGEAGAVTVRSRRNGSFELAPALPGHFTLTAIAAQGFLPFAPELLHSSVHVELAPDQAVRGITLFLFPALDYFGKVIDKAGAPVPGARVRLLGTPTGEQAIDRLETEWITDKAGAFTFHAADDAVFEAVRGSSRGWARLDGDVATTRQLVITIDQAPARDATISGRVVDKAGAPLPDVLVRAEPADPPSATTPVRATSFATTTADGTFTLGDLDRGAYDLAAQRDDLAPITREHIAGGSRNVTLVLDAGLPLAGVVESSAGETVPTYTLLVRRRAGTARELVLARSVVHTKGRFEVRVPPGDYELLAAAPGWAPSAPTPAKAGTKDAKLVVTAGATLRGLVVGKGEPLSYARVMRETHGGGASAQPANAGTVTRADGTFELTGIPPGPVSITIVAGGFHPKIEAGMVATDGAQLGPLTVTLDRLADGEKPSLEVVGIGVQLVADGDALRVDRVIAGGGAEAAGIVVGDRIVAVDGQAATLLGVDGAVAKIRGVAGTTVAITLDREGKQVPLVVARRKIRV